MACTPLAIQAGLFFNNTQGVWNNFNEAPVAGKSAAYSGGTLTVTGPNGSTFFTPVANQAVRHKFFGTGNFMAVLFVDTSAGLGTRTMLIVDFTAPSITTQQVINVLADSTDTLPFLQFSAGSGAACLVGAATSSGIAGLAIFRSDKGTLLCAGPGGPYMPSGQVIGEATAAAVQIKDGGTIIGGPCPFPAGQLQVQPNAQSFPDVKLGGCPQPPSTRTFTLRNVGTDCIDVNAIGAAAPYSVTAQSQAFPADLNPGQSMTVTVTFAPGAVGSFNNVNLPITRTPAKGDSQLTCSGKAVTALPAFTATPGVIDFGHILVHTTAGPDTISIKNTGDVAIAISVPGAPAGSPFQWAGFNGTINCGQTQPIGVTFTPQIEGAAGPQIVSVIATPGGTKTVTLQGEGCIPNAVIGVPPAPFPAYTDVRQSYRMVRFITIGNTGDGPLTFTASLSGPDAALFGIMKTSNSITDVVASLAFPPVLPVQPCGGAAGPGEVQVAVAFFADPTHGLVPANATLTIDNHNDPNAPPSFTFALAANIVAGNVVDVAAVFDKSGSMGQAIPGGGTKTDAAVQAGQLLVQLIPPDLGNRAGVTRFSTTADSYQLMQPVTTADQTAIAGQINAGNLAPAGNTAIAAGAMEGLKQFLVPRGGPIPPTLSKSMIVLTDGMDNTAYLNPDDNKYYSVTGIEALNPTPPPNTVATNPFAPPGDVKVFAVGLGTGQDIDTNQLAILSSGAGGKFLVADPTSPKVAYQLMKYFTQIYMDMVDFATIKDPDFVIYPGQTNAVEFDLLRGDVGAMVVMYDLKGIRLPFYLESPKGEVVDANFVPPGFQLRSGFTNTSRFLDFRLPSGEPDRYAGRWKVVIRHDGQACRGRPLQGDHKQLGFTPRDCQKTKDPIEYGIAIGAGSNFRLQAYVTPGPVKVGDPILLSGVVSEAQLPVLGCTVTVEAVAPGGQSWNLTLADDGAHQDGGADDGEYAKLFTNTAIAGSYVFTFRATGYSHDKEAVTRETVLSKYVEGWLKPPPRGGGAPGGDDACCERLLHLLERQTRLLAQLVKEEERERG
ncbi:MAG: choice-of-anchor D domain-containing protein [Acetobacteraceae bacterium]